jgi:hypothetical protein
MVASFGGTAFASVADASNANGASHGNSANAPGQVKKAAASETATVAVAPAAKPADFVGPVAPAGEAASTTVTAASLVAAPTGSDHSQGNASTTGVSNQPQPLSNADMNKGGANNGGDCGAYCSTRDGSPSLNGNGGGKSTGKPCAGCVGKADNKNPPGQAPNGSDHNNGYECDGNHGIGKGNPAHTACKPTTPPKDCLGVVGGHATAAQCNPPKDCLGVVNGHATAAECNPPKDCLGVVNGHATAAQCNPPKDCLGVVNGHATAADCNPPKDCLGVVNGHATEADCNPPKLCPNGKAMPASGNVADCNPPVVCPAAGTMGPVPAGCSIGGGSGGPGTRPVTGRTVTPSKVVTPVAGTTPGPGTALPFTGSNTALLLQISLLMLLVGGGLTMATRKPRPALALV